MVLPIEKLFIFVCNFIVIQNLRKTMYVSLIKVMTGRFNKITLPYYSRYMMDDPKWYVLICKW